VASAAPFLFNQTSGFQHLQMLRYSRTAYRELGGQFTHRGGTLAQQIEDRLTSGIREGAQQFRFVSHNLR